MSESEVTKQMIALLNDVGVEYMITGASAAIYYGRIRLTHDVDIVIELTSHSSSGLLQLIEKREFYVDADSVRNAIENRSQFNVIHSKTGLKFDFWLIKRDEYNQIRFARKRSVTIYGLKANMITPEDLILTKLLWYKESESEKHFQDALGVYQIQKGNLDEIYITKWAGEQTTLELWQKIKEQSS